MTARSEPLLWLQLVGLGAIPLELLLVLLLLASSDPGPFPGLERVLAWGLGAVAPSVLLWRIPPDPFSLLLLCTPVRLRTPGQLGFSQQPMGLPLKLLLASGTALLLPLLWWLDPTSVLATSYALLPTPNRLTALVAVAPLLTLMVWQWQQLMQATVLLARNHKPSDPPPGGGNPAAATHHQPLCLGLPWLRLPALDLQPAPQLRQEPEGPRGTAGDVAADPGPPQESQPEGHQDDQTESLPTEGLKEPWETASETDGQGSVEIAAEAIEDGHPTTPNGIPAGELEITDVEYTPIDSAQPDSTAVAIEPEQAAEEAEGTDLDTQIG